MSCNPKGYSIQVDWILSVAGSQFFAMGPLDLLDVGQGRRRRHALLTLQSGM